MKISMLFRIMKII